MKIHPKDCRCKECVDAAVKRIKDFQKAMEDQQKISWELLFMEFTF
jgi:hypothetical protein